MKFRDFATLIVLGMAGGTIFLLPYMKYYFYNQMINNTGLSGESLGFLITMFGIASSLVLLPGGIIADRLSSRKCIVLSLISTAFLSMIYSFYYISYTFSLIIWFFLAFTTLFLAWPAIFKSIRIIGGKNSGMAYGIYYASAGLTAALTGYITIKIYSFLSTIYPEKAYFCAIWVSAIANIAVGFALYYMLGNIKDNNQQRATGPSISTSLVILKMPIIWVISIILFCTYTLQMGMTFFTPYLTSTYAVSNETSGVLSLFRTYVFMSLTPLTGFIADRFLKSTLKWFLIIWPIVIICLSIVILGHGYRDLSLPIIILSMFTAFFVCTLYSSMFSILSECKIPLSIAGTAIGFVSIFAYSPDIIMQPLFGYFADHQRYSLIFSTLIILGILSIISCVILLSMNKKNIRN